MNVCKCLLVCLLALGASWAAGAEPEPWEAAALNGVKAINSGNADLFLAWAHPAEQYRLKAMFGRQLMTPDPNAPSVEAQLRPYGIKTLEDLARMPEAAFVAIAIPYQYAQNDEVMKAAMARATFTVSKSVKVEEDHYQVHIDLHVPLGDKPLDRELVANVVKEGDAWKYNGLQ